MKRNKFLNILVCMLLIFSSFVFIESIKADYGDIVDTIDLPVENCYGLTWDGNYFWITQNDFENDNIYQIYPSGDIKTVFSARGNSPYDIAWDGNYLWQIDANGHKIWKLTTSGETIGYIDHPGSFIAEGITWDGSYLWVVDNSDDTIYKVSTSNQVVDSFTINWGIARGLAWDGTNLWNVGNYAHLIRKISTDGQVLESFTYPGNGLPKGCTFDGEYLCVLDGLEDKIHKIDIDNSPEPILSFSPDTIHFETHDQGWSGSKTFEIWNSGTGALSYSFSEDLNWITSINPSSGSSTGEHDTITVNVGNTGSMSGYYSGYIQINSNDISDSIFVDLTINAPPVTSTIIFQTDPSDKGSINFDGSTYTNGENTEKQDGTYSLSVNVPAEYEFVNWQSTGGITISNDYSQSTSATIVGDGTIIAFFEYNVKRTINFYTDPTNAGGIRFDDYYDLYQNGETTQKEDGSYYLHADLPPNFSFNHWETTGGITVDDTSAVQTFANVNGDGSIKAFFNMPEKASWTVIYHMAGNDNLGFWVSRCLNYIDNVDGAGEDVNILVLIDGSSTGDTEAYSIKNFAGGRNEIPLQNINPSWVSGELNMGDPNTLIDFSEYCITLYPADHYMIVPQNHGGHYLGCCWEEGYADNLDLYDLKQAFSAIKSMIGQKIDIVFFNDCLMNAMEVAYQISPYVKYQAGAETVSFTSSFDDENQDMLQNMIDNPSISALSVSKYITNNQEIYDYSDERLQCVSTINLGLISTLNSYVDGLAQDLLSKLSDETFKQQIKNARKDCEYTIGPAGGYTERIIDLYDFAEKIKSHISDSSTKTIAQNIMNTIGPVGGDDSKCVIAERHTTSTDFCHGISIYFPRYEWQYDSDYETGNNFATNTKWDDFIYEFLNPSITPEFGWDAYISAASADDGSYGNSFSFGELEDATDGYDSDFDVKYSDSVNDIEIYSKKNLNKYKVDIRNGPANCKTWDVYVKWQGSGTITMQLRWDISLINNNIYQYVYLQDKKTGNQINMKNQETYSFSISRGEEHHFQVQCSKTESLVADTGGPYKAKIDKEITITGSASGGTPSYTYEWDLDNDGEYDDQSGKTFTYTWDELGPYDISLKVTDQKGDSVTDDTTVTITKGKFISKFYQPIIQKLFESLSKYFEILKQIKFVK